MPEITLGIDGRNNELQIGARLELRAGLRLDPGQPGRGRLLSVVDHHPRCARPSHGVGIPQSVKLSDFRQARRPMNIVKASAELTQ